MALTEEDAAAIKTRILELEKSVSDIGRALKENPESLKLGTELEKAKDLITKLNLRVEHMEKKPKTTEGGNDDGNEDELSPW